MFRKRPSDRKGSEVEQKEDGEAKEEDNEKVSDNGGEVGVET